MNRRKLNITERYPDLEFLSNLPPGTVIDGEVVVLDQTGKPVFEALLTREQAQSSLKIRTLAKATPATYLAFDQLYDRFEPIMHEPLSQRRRILQETLLRVDHPRMIISDGVIGPGMAFFQNVADQGLEGVVAKRLSSPYLPGKRTDAWIKIKRQQSIVCAIIGFVEDGDGDFESMILAAEDDGQLQCVGKVGTGYSLKLKAEIHIQLRSRIAAKPLVACAYKGTWVMPGLFCEVRFLEKTKNGNLRAPVFERMCDSAG